MGPGSGLVSALGGALGGSTVGRAVVELVGDRSQLSRDFAAARGETEAFANQGAAASARFGKAWQIAGVVAGAALVKFAVSSVHAFTEAQQVGAQTAAVIASTGGEANVTAGHVAELTGSLQDLSGIEDETIQEGANMLLTFRNIRNEVGAGNDIFDQAVNVLVDMSVAIKDAGIEGSSMSSMAIKLGKALNDPVKGVTALTRVGVTFTEQQKAQITAMANTGRTADAQRIILEELRAEFGGSAEAAGDTFAGALGKLRGNFNDLQESFGEIIVRGLEPFVRGITFVVDAINGLPAPLKGAIGVGVLLTGTLVAIGSAVKLVRSSLGELGLGLGTSSAQAATATAAQEQTGIAMSEMSLAAERSAVPLQAQAQVLTEDAIRANIAAESMQRYALATQEASAVRVAPALPAAPPPVAAIPARPDVAVPGGLARVGSALTAFATSLTGTITLVGAFAFAMVKLDQKLNASKIEDLKQAFGPELAQGISINATKLDQFRGSYEQTTAELARAPEPSGWQRYFEVVTQIGSFFSGGGFRDDIATVADAQLAAARATADGTFSFREFVSLADSSGKAVGEAVISNEQYAAEMQRIIPLVDDGTISQHDWAAAVAEGNDRGIDAATMLAEYRGEQIATLSATADANTVIKSAGETFRNFAVITGQTADELRTSLVEALKEGPGAVDEFVTGIRGQLEEFRAGVASDLGGVGDVISSFGDRQNLTAGKVVNSFERQEQAIRTYGRNYRVFARDVGRDSDGLLAAVQSVGMDGSAFLQQFADAGPRARKRMVDSLNGIQDAAQTVGDQITDSLVPAFEKMINRILKAAGLDPIKFRGDADMSAAKGRITDFLGDARRAGFTIDGNTRFHEGGPVQGPSGKEVQAKLLAGEFVTNPRQTGKYRGLLEAINSGKLDRLLRSRRGTEGAELPKFHDGGYVGVPTFHGGGFVDPGFGRAADDVDDLTAAIDSLDRTLHNPPDLIAHLDAPNLAPIIPTGEVAPAWGGFANGRIPTSAMTPMGGGFYLEPTAAAAFKASGATLSGVTSMYRSYEQQAGLFRTVTGPVAPPGQSMHGWGKAVDATIGSQAWRALDGPGRAFNWRPGTSFGDPVHHSWGHTGRTGGFVKRDGRIDVHSGEVITNPRSTEGMHAMVEAFSKAMIGSSGAMEQAFRRALTDRAVARALANAMREVKLEVHMREETISRSQHRKRLIREG